MLIDALRAQLLPAGARALDLCTGSGVLAIAAARLPGVSTVTAVDVSRKAVAATRLNAFINGVRVHAIRGDLFGPVAGRTFELIVSNPPYVPTVDGTIPARGLARAWEGGPDGRVVIDRICERVAQHLRPGGIVVLVQSTICGEAATLDALARTGLDASVLSRHPGPLGPLMQARASALRERGLLGDADHEEVLVIGGRATRSQSAPTDARPRFRASGSG
jgi:release factor glutamine methyltransferase